MAIRSAITGEVVIVESLSLSWSRLAGLWVLDEKAAAIEIR